jgi:glucose-6-phosphate 1-epimerase
MLLWLSEKAYFEKGKAIRGGVPICFPWFGKNTEDASLPQHGFSRNQIWKLISSHELADGSTHLQLMLTANKETRALWDYSFTLIYDINIGTELSMELTTLNSDTEAFEITQALHSYFNVSNIQNVSVKGLENTIYYDSLTRGLAKQHKSVIIEKEVDRVYFDQSPNITLVDNEREIKLSSEGSKSLVLWNPWSEKSKAMTDMEDDGYETMLCLETGNVLKDFVIVGAGESHTIKVIIK